MNDKYMNLTNDTLDKMMDVNLDKMMDDNLDKMMDVTFMLINNIETIKDPVVQKHLRELFNSYIPPAISKYIAELDDDVIEEIIESNLGEVSSLAFNERTTREILKEIWSRRIIIN